MLTFKQFVTELARKEVTVSPAEVEEMTRRFGKKVLQMGHLQEDGSMLISVDCILEAAPIARQSDARGSRRNHQP
jgi:hypothetical protein